MNDQRVVIVTGSSQGMGAAVARWLGKAQCAVTLIARNEDKLFFVARDVERLGGVTLCLPMDVSDDKACALAVSKTLDQFGRLDALVNNAGIVQPVALIAQTDPQAWRYTIEVNLLGPFYLARAAISPLRKTRGRIINISTGAAIDPMEAWSAYCASKAGLTHFTRVLAAEEKSITSIALRPGVVDTEMQALIRMEGPGNMPDERAVYFQRLKAEGQLEPPEVPARSIAWLALKAPPQMSGRFITYDDAGITTPARNFLGDSIE